MNAAPPFRPLHEPFTVVTGALGFVGLHLVKSLVRAGQPVLGVGRHETGNPLPERAGSYRRLGPVTELPGAFRFGDDEEEFLYLPCALENPGPIGEVLKQVRPATVYHLAAQSSAARSFQDPGDTFASNVMGTLHLLEAVRALPEAERPVVLSVGSSEEYGPRPVGSPPLREDDPLEPISPYGVSKAAQTLLCRQYARSWDLPIIAVRSFSHTGPGHDTRFAFPAFARQIAAAEAGAGPREILTGDLSPVRDFLDVRDVVEAYRLLVKSGTPGRIYNVCSGRPLTIAQGLELLRARATVEVEIRRDPDRIRPVDNPHLVGDNSRLRRETGWEPCHDFANTLADLLEAAREEFS